MCFLLSLDLQKSGVGKIFWKGKKKTLKPSVGGREAEAYLGKSDRFGA